MEYMGNSAWWNERFKSRKLEILQHEWRLELDAEHFKGMNRVLDLACGDGRNSIYLAKKGYEVYAVDFSGEAINRLKYFSQEAGVMITTKMVDVTSPWELSQLDCKVDAIIVNHYRPLPKVYPVLSSLLCDNGVLWVNGFASVPEDNPNIKADDIIQDEDFDLLLDCDLLSKAQYEIGQRKFVRYIWKK